MNFKEELWDTVVKFGEPVLMGTGLDEKAIKEDQAARNGAENQI